MSAETVLEPGRLSLAMLRAAHREACSLTLSSDDLLRLEDCARAVAQAAAGEAAIYGVNTGFGRLASTRIDASRLLELQRNLIRSHSVGVGDPLAAPVVRLVLLLKAAALARGHSGVRPVVAQMLLKCLALDLIACIPQQGSVGASGDLAPLAHLTLALCGEGEFMVEGVRQPASEVLARHGMAPLELQAKEGLALINGTQVSTALALHALFRIEPLFEASLVSAALCLDAARGSDGPFDERIHALRGQRGQIDVAAACRALTEGSEIRASHREGDDRVQDPYCLRCEPQVAGACLDQLRHSAQVLLTEANAVTDNPLVFVRDGQAEFVSGGNFHAEPVALAADNMAVAVAELGAIAERRIAMLIDTTVSRLPPFLCAEPGLNSGFMIAHVTAAALASENKSLAHPASVDSLPTSANQEDHVSMATFAARRLGAMIDNVAAIVGIELLAAAQGIEFLRPLRSSPVLERAHALLRSRCQAMPVDRYLAPDIEQARQLVAGGELAAVLRSLPQLQTLRLF
jgi:histidine ammonia-lyase